MNPNEDLNNLGYASSAPDIDFGAPVPVKAQDEQDAPTLRRIFKLLEAQKYYYTTVHSVDLTSTDEGLREQLKDNKRMLNHLEALESLLMGTLTKIQEKELNNG